MRSVKTVAVKAVTVLAAALAALTLLLPSSVASASIAITHASSNVAPTSDGTNAYAWVSYFRHLSGESSVGRNTTLEAGVAAHVRYLANYAQSCETDVHTELTSGNGYCPANPRATAAGKAAAENSDITRISNNVTPRVAISGWFTSAFHALVLLDPKLRSTGYASYYTANPAGTGQLSWPFTAGVDVYRGRTGSYNGNIIAFPATGATSPLTSYKVGTEYPEPFRTTTTSSPCHSWGSLSTVSAPLIVQWPAASRPNMGGSIIDLTTGAAQSTCTLTPSSYPAGSEGRMFLAGTNGYTKAAFYYARTPFVPGHRYALRVGGTTVSTFNIANIPGAAPTTAAALTAAAKVTWQAASAGTGAVKNYQVQLFRTGCTGAALKVASMNGGARSATFSSLARNVLYYTRTVTINSLVSARPGACKAVVTH